MKGNKLWIVAAIITLIISCGAWAGIQICGGKTTGIQDTGIITGEKNRCLAYDEEKQILYVGTHNQKIAAFQNGEEVWTASGGGTFRRIILDRENRLLYGANEDNHIYVYDPIDGKLVQDIDTQRRVMGMDLAVDGSKVAVLSMSGSRKSNLLIYKTDGTLMESVSYKNKLLGLAYCNDNETLMLANNRGELKHIKEDGEEISSYKFPKGIVDLKKKSGQFWILSEDGSYYVLNEELDILREGKADNSMQADMTSIGFDSEGNYVLLGTEQGYLFVMDESDRQTYMTKLDMEITDFAADGENIYITGTRDQVELIYADNLAGINRYLALQKILRGILTVCLLLLTVCIVMAVPVFNTMVYRVVKRIWKNRMAYVLLFPTMVLLVLFSYYPIGISFSRAFTNWSVDKSILADIDFIGLDNFINMFKGGNFLIGMKNMVLLIVTGLIKTLTVPLAVAWLVFNIKGERRKFLHRFLFVLPIVVPGVVGALTWLRIYDPSTGLINNLLGVMHLEQLQRVWLGDEKLAIWAIIFMGFPFIGAMAFLVFYGGLINIGKELEESAMIDGASRFRIFKDIQYPLLKSQRNILILLCIIGNIQDFNSIFIMTNGGPGNSTYVPALELYLNVARSGQYGYASAMGVVLTIFTIVVTMVSNQLTKEKG